MSISVFPVFQHLAGAGDRQAMHYPELPARPATTDSQPDSPTESPMASKANLRSSGREAALARRRALSNQGKQGLAQTTQERKAAPRPVRARPERAAAPSAPVQASAPAQASVQKPTRSLNLASSSSAHRHRAAPPSPAQSSRELARQRRAKLARDGRRAQRSGDRVRDLKTHAGANKPAAQPKSDCGCGCNGKGASGDRAAANRARQTASAAPSLSLSAPIASNKPQATNRGRKPNPVMANKPAGRAVALARRAALSGRGKAATNVPHSVAGIARQANPKLSGRELAQRVRDQRSSNGSAGERKSQPTGRMRPTRVGSADQPWKVGVSETSQGQFVTGTTLGRSLKTTGDEPSTCRTITGTEYMGADIFREFCQTDPAPAVSKIGASATGYGNFVTGNEVGRSPRVTGDEPGTCKTVTGTQYLSPDQYESYCNTRPAPEPRETGVTKTGRGQGLSGTMVGRSAKVTGDEQGANVVPTGTQYTSASEIPTDRSVPPKVGTSGTLSGGTITGTRVGRASSVTGDEPGSCRLVTGDEYTGREQYEQFCQVSPQPEPPKVGFSVTNKGYRVSGTQTGRSSKVTGDEPGTCKAVTGTPYAGLEQASDYCAPNQQREIKARAPVMSATPGRVMTGIQPGIGGLMTGASKGACEPLTGTPYVGADQFASACDTGVSNAAEPGHPDFPRFLDESSPGLAPAAPIPVAATAPASPPGRGFSVSSPARAAFETRTSGVTGTSYESNRHITGPFGMGTGKITGTEQFRFDNRRARPSLLTPEPSADAGADKAAAASERSRVTGEGQSAGGKITGDDWDRGERVTGTEGSSARRRNPTRPGLMGAMPAVEAKRNEETPQPTNRVTGSAGSTDRGALITYSGGARG
ncbi:MAG: CsoS2 family carboxysome shell protein [Lamprobacter sp.]|uniref:CsoS2 family carboxysome shell protein n=1 Tax=Lamprobacter sp. TaxID=3100796 RepID=UPI002B25A4C6|nr:CsoS2 family carboxysome shell protein [Lamprobacter sp.]MEA3640891.1 CsoS2 family carboxysome shell protein [Lamprobacter sp.]